MNDDEPVVVADFLSWFLRAPFRATKIPDARTEVGKRAKWFIWCSDIAYTKKVGHVKYVWKEPDGSIWLESSELGDTIGLIEEEYGEKGARELMKMDLTNFNQKEVRESFDAKFPRAAKRFDEWNRVLDRISKKRGVRLQLRFDGARDIVLYMIGVNIGPVNGTSELTRIKAGIGALKEAYEQVLEVE
jgi:hypothetical protein